MRAVQVDVVNIESHSGFEASHRILLTDAANECGQGCIGAAADLEREVGHFLRYLSNLERATFGQCFAGNGSDGKRHVLNALLTPARCHHDYVVVIHDRGRLVLVRGLGRRGRCKERGGCGAAKQARNEESGGFHNVNLPPNIFYMFPLILKPEPPFKFVVASSGWHR